VVIMPKQGQSVESCIIGKWHKNVGDDVAEGDVLFSYETDKAAFDEVATVAGKLTSVFFAEGDDVPCLEEVCELNGDGRGRQAILPVENNNGDGRGRQAILPVENNVEQIILPAGQTGLSVFPSPRARTLASQHNIDPATIPGTGPNGRVIERDVERVILEGGCPHPPPSTISHQPSAFIKHSAIRKLIAKSMMKSLSTMAQLTLNTSFDATAILNLRKRLKAAEGDSAPTLGDIVLFAVARTLLQHPELNAHYDDEKMTLFHSVNLGVAIDTPRGLMVPTLFGADRMSLADIAAQVKTVAADCRKGTVNPDTLTGGTFTVTNLGALGIESFTPVINPPQTAILGVCGITQRVRTNKNNGFDVYSAMGLSLTIDHRAVDGAPAAKFLQSLCGNLENIETIFKQ